MIIFIVTVMAMTVIMCHIKLKLNRIERRQRRRCKREKNGVKYFYIEMKRKKRARWKCAGSREWQNKSLDDNAIVLLSIGQEKTLKISCIQNQHINSNIWIKRKSRKEKKNCFQRRGKRETEKINEICKYYFFGAFYWKVSFIFFLLPRNSRDA